MAHKRFVRVVASAVMCLLLVSSMLTGPAIAAVGGASRSQDVGYDASGSIPGVWSAKVDGRIRFYGTERRFRVFGRLVVRGPEAALLFNTYLAVHHNAAGTSRDGRWFTIGYPGAGTFDGVLGLTGGHDSRSVRNFVVGGRGGGEQFRRPTRPGHPLAGVWVRVCYLQGGPDVCGSTTYADNPYT